MVLGDLSLWKLLNDLVRDPEPDPDQSTLVSVANVMELDNGQAGAFVIERRPNGEDIASYGTFVKEGDLWKVDKIYDFPSADDSNG